MWRAHRLHSITVAMGFIISLPFAAQAAVGDGYSMAMQIAFTGYSGGVTLTNYPALIVLSNGTAEVFDYSEFLSPPNADLRFADAGGAELNYEVDTWDDMGQSFVWVQVPLLYNGAVITCYWGKVGESVPGYTTDGSTWSEGYAGVWHLKNSSPGDATMHGYDGTGHGNVDAAGVVGIGQSFNGSGQYVSVPRPIANNWTISFFANTTQGSASGDQWWQGYGLVDGEVAGSADDFGVTCLNGKAALGVGNPDTTIQSTSTINDGNWVHVACTRNSASGEMTVYINGALETTDTGPTGTKDTPADLHFGNLQTGIYAFNGVLDEVQISLVTRSSDWLLADYANQIAPAAFAVYTSRFITPGKPVIGNRPPRDVSTNTATAVGSLVSAGGTATTVNVYYGDTDGGSVPAAWGASSNLGVKAEGEVTYSIAGLVSGSNYYYRFFATNVYGGAWAGSAVRFTTAGPASLSNVPAQSVKTTTALAGADIISTGGLPTTVSVYYGATDGGTTSSAWNRVLDLGVQPVGLVSVTLTGLPPGTNCHYRFFAANAAGGVWAGSSEAFVTKPLFDPWGYTKAMQIVFTGYSGVETLTNFPALVVLSNGSAGVFYYTDFLSPPNGDLRFEAADGSELNYEIDTWNNTDQSFVWVQVPLLYDGAVITCFWGKVGASSPVCTSNGTTWSEGYLSVHHLSTNYTDGTWALDSAADLSSGDLGVWGELVDYGTPYYEADDWQAGKIGMCIALNSEDTETTEYISLVDGYPSFKNGLTFSVWVNENAAAGAGVWQPFVDIDDNGEYMIVYDSEGYIDFYTWANEEYGWPDDFLGGLWYNTVITLSKGGAFAAYQNGEPWWTSSGLAFPSDHVRSGNSLGWTAGWEEWLPGKLDDVQIADVVRSPDWVKAAYDNQNDPSTFAAYTPAEVPVPEPAAAAAGLVVGCWLWAVRGRKRGR